MGKRILEIRQGTAGSKLMKGKGSLAKWQPKGYLLILVVDLILDGCD
jgi:hypothetical protein